ncbi:serine/threonine-protein kinase [Streptomyces sp. NPDC023723]|uniref:serine/threonine-protein kinase n=1 Tax=Streptomyces sp. NPDC023723 TaxID=3154323 RepID=UPI0033F38045
MEKLAAGDPHRVGDYRLLARLGAGGMGRVYLARSDRGRTVAVKLVHAELARQDEFRARFRQEVAAARRVGGYWTAPVLDADTEAAVPWVATGYVAGPSLQRVIGHDHGALPERSVRILGAGLAHALQDIHAAGIVHRDLKPSNVLITIDGPRVIDFGIARALEAGTAAGLTHTGALVGSPGFMAPEQIRGEPLTPACDVFCLGSVLAYAATGTLPFGTADSGVHALMFRIAQEEPDLTGVPEGIADLVGACLRKDPAARPALGTVLARTGAQDTVADGRSRDPWLPGALVAQLGRHAVRLLEAEEPVGEPAGETAGETAGAGAPASSSSPVPPAGSGPSPGPSPVPSPVLAPPPVRSSAPSREAAYQQPQPQPQPQSQPEPEPQPHPHPHPHPHPQPYPYPYPAVPPVGPVPPPRRGPSTVLLVVIALVVALAAGGSVYALMNGDGASTRADDGAPAPTPTAAGSGTPEATGPATADDRPTTPAPDDGAVPAGYLGTWTTTIDNATGTHQRRLTIEQGEVGDTVLSLVADGDGYHCVFRAELAADPGGDGPVRFGPSEVTVGEPSQSCTPGSSSEATLLPDGSLERVLTSDGKKLTFTRE